MFFDFCITLLYLFIIHGYLQSASGHRVHNFICQLMDEHFKLSKGDAAGHKIWKQGYFCLMFVCPKASWLISLSLSFLIYRIEKHTFAFYNSENFSFPYSFSHAKIKNFNFLILLWIYSHYRKIVKLDK